MSKELNYTVQKDGNDEGDDSPVLPRPRLSLKVESAVDPSPCSKEESKIGEVNHMLQDMNEVRRSTAKKRRHQRNTLLDEGVAVADVEEPKFLRIIPLARGCLCGCISLKCAMTILTLIDITFGLASIGIIYITITSQVPVTALIFRVILYMLGGIFATYSLIQLYNGCSEEVARDHLLYLITKGAETFFLRFIDIFTIY